MEKILLVEDNENIMDINSRYLSDQGYEIGRAYSVKQAEDSLDSFDPDLIVLDVMLPDGDGMELCRDIRRKSGVPILFLTAKVTGDDIVAGLESGGDEYLTKPYDLSILGARVKALLRRSARILPQSQIYAVGLLRLDIVQSQAFVGSESLSLSRNEFGLLLYLAQHMGRRASGQDICRAIWGADTESEKPLLWTTVSRLKKKLAPYEEQFYIDSDHSGYELMIPAGRS